MTIGDYECPYGHGCMTIWDCFIDEFNNNPRWKSECNRFKKERPDLVDTEICRIVFARVIDEVTKDAYNEYSELYGIEYSKRIAEGLNMLGKLKLQNSFKAVASESGDVIRVEIDPPTLKEMGQIADSMVDEMFGKEKEEYIKKHLKERGFEEDNYLERVDSKEREWHQFKEVIVQQHIHIGDKIGTQVKDSFVQRSNVGAGARKCPHCGRDVEADGKFCLECGARL